MSDHRNPYRAGSAYFKAFEFLRHAKAQTVTREQMVAAGVEGGWTGFDVTVVLSPREVGTSRGNPAGNFSAQGEVYFLQPRKVKASMKKVQGKMVKVAGMPKTFTLRWRKEALAPHVRVVAKAKKVAKVVKEVKAEKVRKVAAKVEAPAATVEPVAEPKVDAVTPA